MKYNYNARQFYNRNKLLEESHIDSYNDFLKSEFWQNIKVNLRQREFFKKCSCCGIYDNIQLHHIKYKNFLSLSSVKNIFPLCGDCHNKVHNISREQNISFKTAMKKLRKANSFKPSNTERRGGLKGYAEISGDGNVCKHCKTIMQRRIRVSKPLKKVNSYFTEWDYCANCGKIQFYEQYRVNL